MTELAPRLEELLHRPASGVGVGQSADLAFVVGPRLVAKGADDGPLSGTHFAVKDLYDVAGTRTGAGNPEWLNDAPLATKHAVVVQVLVDAGAELVGKTVTDELAFSLSGTNVHYGTPPNPKAPGHIPGGSSSGSASAVASSMVDFALATDTGGSTRVPASYCGLFGLRASHDRLSSEGVFLLAPSFCTIGVLTRDGSTMGKVWRSLRTAQSTSAANSKARDPERLILAPELFALADHDAEQELLAAARHLGDRLNLEVEVEAFSVGDRAEMLSVFRVIQMYEAWARHGDWILEHPGALGPGIHERFMAASKVQASDWHEALKQRAELRQRFDKFLGENSYLVQPSASGVAPPLDLGGSAKDDLRRRTLELTAPAGLAGSPVLSLPLASIGGLPIGLSLVGRNGDDESLVDIAALLSASH